MKRKFERTVFHKFLKANPKITLEQTVARLVAAEARLAAQAGVIREAIKLAKSEPLFFSDESGGSYRVRPSPLKRAVTQMKRRESKP